MRTLKSGEVVFDCGKKIGGGTNSWGGGYTLYCGDRPTDMDEGGIEQCSDCWDEQRKWIKEQQRKRTALKPRIKAKV